MWQLHPPSSSFLPLLASCLQARFKKSDVFNLEEEELTHMGTSLSKMDDFGEDFKDSSDDEEGGNHFFFFFVSSSTRSSSSSSCSSSTSTHRVVWLW